MTWWSTRHVRTWSERPWNQDGKQLPLVHHASVGVEVKFRDFAELARWVGRHAEHTAGFSLDGVEWALTEKRQQELARQVRTRAVQDAAARAQEYADALGLGPVRPVALADAGMLSSGLHPMAAGAEAAFMRAGKAADSDAASWRCRRTTSRSRPSSTGGSSPADPAPTGSQQDPADERL